MRNLIAMTLGAVGFWALGAVGLWAAGAAVVGVGNLLAPRAEAEQPPKVVERILYVSPTATVIAISDPVWRNVCYVAVQNDQVGTVSVERGLASISCVSGR